MSGKNAVTKADFIRNFKNALADKEIYLTSKMTKDAYDIFIGIIEENLVSGGKVMLSGIGTLKVSERPPRKGRNPRTGESISVPATKNTVFRQTLGLKAKLNK